MTTLRDLSGPAELYLHVPFCAEQCAFCGCNMVVSGRQSVGDVYLDRLEKRFLALPAMPSATIARVHLGGGTPTWFDPAQLTRLIEMVRAHTPTDDATTWSVEADPEITTEAHLDCLADLGFRRISFGVQSFDETVQTAVHRLQDTQNLKELVAGSKARGMRINLDLMYGLPKQTLASLTHTLEAAAAMNVDRMAVFGYAHVPWLKKNQRRIDDNDLPDRLLRAAMSLRVREVLEPLGYTTIGFDHYATAEDDLARAVRERRLHRNFMGYTTLPDAAVIGLGMSAISDVGDLYWQSEPRLGPWRKAVDAGAWPIHRGTRLTAEDRLRRHVIHELTCNLGIDIPAVEERFSISFNAHFATALQQLGELERAGLVRTSSDRIEVTERGRPLLRLAAMPFDAYLTAKNEGRFSAAV
jgi:oxygen-independent coproporphyrinogen-3 oxidase